MFDEAFNISIGFDEVITSGTENCEYVTIAAEEGGFSLQATYRALKWLFNGFKHLFIGVRTDWETV